MSRIPNTRPTLIYWLIDIRPDTLINRPNGRPFYCGKTVFPVLTRLKNHRVDMMRHPQRPISSWLKECGENVRVQVMEIVPPSLRWSERERFWIYTIRLLYPGGANISDGGEGAPGYVFPAELRAAMSAFRKGKPHSPQHRAKIGAANRRRVVSLETRLKIAAARRGKPTTTGRVFKPETLEKMRAAKLGTKHTSEQRAKMVASRRANRAAREQ